MNIHFDDINMFYNMTTSTRTTFLLMVETADFSVSFVDQKQKTGTGEAKSIYLIYIKF